MKEIEIALLVDTPGGRDIFDRYASEIEQSYIDGDLNYDLNGLMNKIQVIERKLQDLSEYINAKNENEENIYNTTIEKSRQLLNNWIGLFIERNRFPNILVYLNGELDKLEKYVDVQNIEKKLVDQIKKDFETNFTLEAGILENYASSLNYQKAVEESDYAKISDLNSYILGRMYAHVTAKVLGIYSDDDSDNQSFTIEDGEDVLYTWEMDVWIDTTDAVQANKFMSLIASVIGYIENVEIEIIDSKVASLFQKWKVRFHGWFSKDETKQILNKGVKAIESYTLDRHIEPIEKSKVERKKTEADMKRLMSEEQTMELHDLLIQEKREEVRSKKLSNLKQELEIRKALTDMMANGLLEIDSDFKVMINGLLLIKQENKKIEIGNIDDIDEISKKEEISTS